MRQKRGKPSRVTAGPLNSSLPGGFDGHGIAQPQAPSQARLRYLARRLHALGPKPLYHFLDEVERGAPLRPHLERYARLPADFIREHHGDQFAPPRVIKGGSP